MIFDGLIRSQPSSPTCHQTRGLEVEFHYTPVNLNQPKKLIRDGFAVQRTIVHKIACRGFRRKGKMKGREMKRMGDGEKLVNLRRELCRVTYVAIPLGDRLQRTG